MSSSVQQLAAQLVRMERELRAIATTPALAYSSIEGGGSIDSNAGDGHTMAQFGGQFDGSYMAASLVGPTPPTPSAPIVTPTAGGLIVRWDGLFTDADFAPMDFSRIEIHVSTDPDFVPDTATTLVATIETPRGAEPFIAQAVGTYYVAFVARSLSGKAGLKSATVGPTTSSAASQSVFASLSNFTLTTKSTFTVLDVIKTVTITVPAGFTAANISVISRVFAYNNNGSGGANTLGADYFAGQTCIAGIEDDALSMIVLGQGSSGISISPLAATLTGLTPGSTFTITIGANSYYLDWAANPLNTATVSGNILWFR